MTETEAMDCLRHRVERHGSQQAAAKALGVSPQYLSDVLAGRRKPDRMLRRLGMAATVDWEMADDASS